MYLNVLVPLDGSENSESAIEEALELASSMKSVHLMLVENTAYQTRQLEGFTFYVDKYMEIRKQSGMDYLAPFKEKLEAAGLKVTVEVGFGDPVPVIEKAANRLRTDMVILGGNSGGWLERHVGLAKYGRRLSQKLSSTVLTVQPKDRKEKVPEAA
jgi:nucleotide-binding universal stress UspA family protein